MKTLNITFEDEEYEYLKLLKGESEMDNWRTFILELAEYEVKP